VRIPRLDGNVLMRVMDKSFNIFDPDGNQIGIVETEINKGIWK
jgi:hypothetical protein